MQKTGILSFGLQGVTEMNKKNDGKGSRDTVKKTELRDNSRPKPDNKATRVTSEQKPPSRPKKEH